MSAPAQPPAPVLRGSHQRITNFMEQLQIAYVSAVAAAAGCVLSEPRVDDGIDLDAKHTHNSHTSLNDRVARLDIQLKATGQPLAAGANVISVSMSRARWLFYNTVNPAVNKIIVVMSLPTDQMNWTKATPAELAVRHCAYWVNIAGLPDGGAEHPTVAAPLSQVFDDIALCGIMERIGKGMAP